MHIVQEALEGAGRGGSAELERRTIEQYAALLVRILKKYCAIFKIGEPAYAYVRGCLAWHGNRPDQAYRLWGLAADRGESLGMALEAGKAHLLLGERLPPAHPDRSSHLSRARELFAGAGFENWAARVPRGPQDTLAAARSKE
jgi:hypothetical protein